MTEYIIKNEAMRSLLEGLMLIVGVLALLAYVNSAVSYNLNYDIIPDSSNITLQQNTDYKLNLFFKLNSNEDLSFRFETVSDKGIYTYVPSQYNSYRDFTIPLIINVSNLEPKEYTIYVYSKVIYGGILNTKVLPINIKVIPKENIIYKTTNFTNELPNLVLLDISSRNLLMDKNSNETIVFKFKNLGSDSTFFINNIIDSVDKNKVHVNYSQKYFFLKQNEEKNILVNISLDSEYNVLQTPIYFYAQEQTTKQQLDLKQINVTLKTQNILFNFDKNTNMLEIANFGTDIAELDINTNKKEINFLLMPNQRYLMQIDKDENNALVFLNKTLFKELNLGSDSGIIEINNKSSFNFSQVAGLFSFGSGSIGWIIAILFIVCTILIVRKLFFAPKAVFGKNFYVKDLQNKG